MVVPGLAVSGIGISFHWNIVLTASQMCPQSAYMQIDFSYMHQPHPGHNPYPIIFSYHRIIGWKRPLRSSVPTIHPTPPCLLNHMPKGHIYMVFEHLQGRGLNHLPGLPVPISDHSFSKEIFPDSQSKPPLMQLEAIASRPIASYLGEETNTCLTTTSFQVVIESNKVSPQPPSD